MIIRIIGRKIKITEGCCIFNI